MLQRVSLACLTIAVFLGTFCWWGLETAAGRRAFDEMAGLIPFWAGLASAAFALLALVLWGIGRRPGRRPRS